MRTGQDPAGPAAFPRWWVRTMLVVALTGLAWRHWRGQVPFEQWQHLNILLDKWHLGPLRLINFVAILTLVLRYGPALSARLPRMHFLETLGAASLPVFCAHLVVVLLALAVLGMPTPERPVWIDVALLGVTFAILYAVALLSRAGAAGVAAVVARTRPAAPVSGSAR